MIEIRRDDQNKIIAFIEWNLLDKYGGFDDQGEQVWVQEIFIHPDYRNSGILENFIKTIARKAPTAEYARFRNRIIKNGVEEFSKLKKYPRYELVKYTYKKEERNVKHTEMVNK